MTVQVESMEEFDKWCLDVLRQNFELTIDGNYLFILKVNLPIMTFSLIVSKS